MKIVMESNPLARLGWYPKHPESWGSFDYIDMHWSDLIWTLLERHALGVWK